MKPVPDISLAEAIESARRALNHDELVYTVAWKQIVKAMLPAAEYRLMWLKKVEKFERDLGRKTNGE